MANSNLAHEEVWDDSALLTSWNDAFAEYKKYHSIAAKGGKIDPPAPSAPNSLPNGNATTTSAQAHLDIANSADDEYDPSVGLDSKNGQAAGPSTSAPGPSVAAGAAVPQALLANVQDDKMKNLMMSWYYAGYYTGLYEGKQQGYASALQQQQGG